MMKANGKSTRSEELLKWKTYQGKFVTVYAQEASYAGKQAQVVLREADKIAEALAKIIEPPKESAASRTKIYLADPTFELPAASEVVGYQQQPSNGQTALLDSDGDGILRIVRPEDPGEPIARPLTEALFDKWFGPKVGSAELFIDGIAGLAAARAGTGPTVQEAQSWVRAELAAKHSVSLFPEAKPLAKAAHNGQDNGASEKQSGVDPRLATAFVAYLAETHSNQALRRFLVAYDPDRPDQATSEAFRQPLGTLEEAWLAKLQRDSRGGVTLRSFVGHLLPFYKPYWLKEVEILAYMLLGLANGLVLPLGSKYLIDTILPSGSLAQLGIFSAVLVTFYVFSSAVGLRRSFVNAEVNQRILTDLQGRVFSHLQWLPHDFYGKAKIGDLLSRLSTDLQVVQQAMGQLAGSGIFMTVSALVAAITLVSLNLLLGSLVLLTVPIFAFIYLALRTRLQAASLTYQKLAGESVTMAQESLSAQAVVKAFGLEDRIIARYNALLDSILKASLKLNATGSMFEVSINLAVSMCQLLILVAGGYLIINGSLTIGTLLAFVALLPSLYQPVIVVSTLGQTVQRANGAFNRVTELLEEPVTIANSDGAIQLPPLARYIRFEDVSFSYDGDRKILDGLNLVIPAGTHAAIVGPSGSGKSTVVNLLLRFWDPTEGRLTFDGHDLREATISSIRSQTSIVFQDTFIFDTTLRENIAISRPTATDAEIRKVAEDAQLSDYIASLPAGYDTVLGERGVRMSGGQRQRLAIARALLRNPRVLIFDEATSALDAHTEMEILEILDELARGRTTISITHRLSIAAKADRIYVLDHGRLVEEGSHQELVRAGGLYHKLYEEQTSYATGKVSSKLDLEVARLRSIPLFQALDATALAHVAQQLMPERFASGEDIVRQGEEGDKLYIIDSGQVEVLVGGEQDAHRVNQLADGDFFGEMALVTGETRNATVRAITPTRLYSLSSSDFREL
ncbi:MAG TPA: ABC transporter transmembrane domain-containing protein, partial [Chloroflexia bacterium]|nr:ABC transporter transmembrane domain-containing protein [Chloroflexia bacterium]